jgi:TRAP transporter TAXI family solute receptor
MKRWFASIVACGLLIAWSDASAQKLPVILNIGTYTVGSYYHMVGTAVATVVGNHTSMKTTVKPMAGPAAYYPLMASGEIDLAMANCWDSEKGYLGEFIYEKLSKGKGFPICLIAVSTWNTGGLIVPKDSVIQKYSDLKGKRVAGNLPSPSVQLQTEAYLANGGLTWSDITPIPVSSPAEGVKVVIEGRADASCTAVLGMPVIEELQAKKGARFLSLDLSPDALIRTKKKFPGYPIKVLPGPGRAGVNEEIHLYAYDNYAICRQDLPDDAAYLVVKALWENYQEMPSIHAGLKDWTQDRFVSKEALIPYHPGAIRFYKEKGLWTDEMAKLQESLLAKKTK